MASTAGSAQPLSLRLGEEGHRALADIARRRGITWAEAARQAIAETAERERRRSGLAAEAARYRMRLPKRRGREQHGSRYAVEQLRALDSDRLGDAEHLRCSLWPRHR